MAEELTQSTGDVRLWRKTQLMRRTTKEGRLADWRRRAKVSADVVHFEYVSQPGQELGEDIYVWDLDKTYLDTRFESLSGLFRTAFEKAFQKKNVPGTATLVRNLQSAWKIKFKSDKCPLYFITASPPQLEEKLVEKLRLDGIHPFGLTCKDNLQNLRPKRLWRLTQQVGYKIQALLQLRQHMGDDPRLVLWGDDSESDAIIYSIFSDICSRRLEQKEIRRLLKSLRVVGQQLDTILDLQSKVPKQDPVEKIYINLAEDTDAEYYVKFGRRCLPTYSSFQTAIDLFQDHRFKAEQVVAVGHDLRVNFGFTMDEIERFLDDLIRRKVVGEPCVTEILPVLKENKLIHDQFEPSLAPRAVSEQVGDRVIELEGSFEPWVPERIDYLHDYR